MPTKEFELFERSEFSCLPTASRSARKSEGPSDTGDLSFASFSFTLAGIKFSKEMKRYIMKTAGPSYSDLREQVFHFKIINPLPNDQKQTSLLPFKQLPILSITLLLQLISGNKAQGRGVDAVAQAGRRWAVVKDMAEVGITLAAAYLGAQREEAAVLFFRNIPGLQRSSKTGPART